MNGMLPMAANTGASIVRRKRAATSHPAMVGVKDSMTPVGNTTTSYAFGANLEARPAQHRALWPVCALFQWAQIASVTNLTQRTCTILIIEEQFSHQSPRVVRRVPGSLCRCGLHRKLAAPAQTDII